MSKNTVELAPCESCGGEVRSSLHKCDPKEFARHNAKKLGERTIRVIEKVLAKHDAGVIEGVIEELDALRATYERDTSALRAVIERYASKCGACGGKGFVKLTWSDACAPGFFGANTPSYEEWTACGGKFDCEHCADLRAALHSSPADEPIEHAKKERK